jgi:excisionase family DNA binding protein
MEVGMTEAQVLAATVVAAVAVGVRDAARMAGVSERTMRELIAAGDLPSLRLRGRRLVRVADLEALLAERVA